MGLKEELKKHMDEYEHRTIIRNIELRIVGAELEPSHIKYYYLHPYCGRVKRRDDGTYEVVYLIDMNSVTFEKFLPECAYVKEFEIKHTFEDYKKKIGWRKYKTQKRRTGATFIVKSIKDIVSKVVITDHHEAVHDMWD